MKLILNTDERVILMNALKSYQEDLTDASNQVRSDFIRRALDTQGLAVTAVFVKVADLREPNPEYLKNEVRSILGRSPADGGGLIYAIKYVRAETGLGLKESKEYVEKVRDNA